MEIERKFLLTELPNLQNYSTSNIEQYYISERPEVRIRKSNHNYFLTIKSEGGLCRQEVEKKLTDKEFEILKLMAISKIEKTRFTQIHCIDSVAYVLEIDVYNNLENYKELITVEVEFDSIEQAQNFDKHKPHWFGQELTNMKEYKNKNLARRANND